MRSKSMRRARTITAAAVSALLLPAAGAQAATIAPEQQAVTLLDVKRVTTAPSAGSRMLGVVAGDRPITLRRTTLPVLAERLDAEGRSWLKVRLPGRTLTRRRPAPTGWISAVKTRRSMLRWHVVVDVRKRKVLAYRDGRLMRSFGAIVGNPRTPTPRGDFFIEETLRMPAKYQGGPYALATSARSPVYQEFAGGPGQIALHGVNGIGGQMGTAVSHGCIRMTPSGITWLQQYVKPGTPLTIR
jgi:lipoprotein-anchoring transpeptidase ErfK/SrfK